MRTKKLADKLARRYGTRDPFRIAEALGYIIIDTPLKGIRGYYQYLHRCNIIYLDNGLNENARRWVCAHELGHSFMHKGLNRIFLDTKTYAVTSKFETEANHFAVNLLYSDEQLRPYLERTISTVANCFGLSYDLVEYRMHNVTCC